MLFCEICKGNETLEGYIVNERNKTSRSVLQLCVCQGGPSARSGETAKLEERKVSKNLWEGFRALWSKKPDADPPQLA